MIDDDDDDDGDDGDDGDEINTYMYTVYLSVIYYLSGHIPLIITLHTFHTTVKISITEDIGLLLINVNQLG
jgi:hypothetical protein